MNLDRERVHVRARSHAGYLFLLTYFHLRTLLPYCQHMAVPAIEVFISMGGRRDHNDDEEDGRCDTIRGWEDTDFDGYIDWHHTSSSRNGGSRKPKPTVKLPALTSPMKPAISPHQEQEQTRRRKHGSAVRKSNSLPLLPPRLYVQMPSPMAVNPGRQVCSTTIRTTPAIVQSRTGLHLASPNKKPRQRIIVATRRLVPMSCKVVALIEEE